jgi:hypothetical protein
MVFSWERCHEICFCASRSPSSLDAHAAKQSHENLEKRIAASGGPSGTSLGKHGAPTNNEEEDVYIEHLQWQRKVDSLDEESGPFRNSRMTGNTAGGETSVQTSGAAQPLVTPRDTPPGPSAPKDMTPLPLSSLESCRGAFKTLHKGETPKRAVLKDHRSKWLNRTYLTNLADVIEEKSQTSSNGKAGGPSSLQSYGSK